MALLLFPASEYSVDALTDLYNRARADYLLPMQMTQETFSAYAARYSVDFSASLVAEWDGIPAGLALLGLRDERAWITRMGVLREARQVGMGRALVEGLLDSARARGATEAQLEVIRENAIGLRLFRNCGFVPMRHLLVFERVDGYPTAPAIVPDQILTTAEAIARLDRSGIGYEPSWLEETLSLRRARRLTGLALGESSLIYGDDGGRLTPVVLCNADEVTGPGLLTALHERLPGHPALKENLPEGESQAEWFAVAGYRVVFTRIEMRRTL